MTKTRDNFKLNLLTGSVILAAGLGSSVSPEAHGQTEINLAPMDLLPEVFTRFDYLPRGQSATSAPKQQAQAAAAQETERQIPDQAYAEQDLDLALENFFYALEDLIQSASRLEAAAPVESGPYYAQVQFSPQVMASITPARSQTVATASSAAGSTSGAQLPAIRARNEDAVTTLSEFNYSGTASLNAEHNDNIYTTRNDEVADQILTTNLHGIAESRNRTRAVKFEGTLNTGSYNQNADNNYADWSATGSYSTLLSQRSKAFAGIGYFYHHEDKGEGSTDGEEFLFLDAPLEFESWVARGIYELGSRQSRARIVADGKIDQLRTTNFQDIEAIRARDRDISSLLGTTYYKWTQRLSYLAEVRHMDIQYVNNFDNNLDSTQTRLALGAEWLATRKTAGSVRFGLQQKDFDNPGLTDTDRLSWEVVVEWAPRPRTEIVFETIRDTEESDGFGAARDRTDYKVTWSQKWTPRIDSSTSLQHGTTSFQDETRRDQLNLIDTEFSYSLSSRAAAILKLTYIDNSSNVVEYGFERSQIQLGVNMELD